jgi:SET domain-containing protein
MDGKINNRFFRKETKKWYLSNSKIEGEGVFAAKKIIRGEIIDVAIYLEKITFFGSKINHSWNPCGELIFNAEEHKYNLVAIEDVDKDKEITIDYRKTPTFIKKPDPNWS